MCAFVGSLGEKTACKLCAKKWQCKLCANMTHPRICARLCKDFGLPFITTRQTHPSLTTGNMA
jgi:hypothetical protein